MNPGDFAAASGAKDRAVHFGRLTVPAFTLTFFQGTRRLTRARFAFCTQRFIVPPFL